MYFNTVLLLRAVSRLGPYLSAYDYCSSGSHQEDALTQGTLHNVIDIAQRVGKFDETALFRGENANVSLCSQLLFVIHRTVVVDVEGRVQRTF
jgi:hypothetical protein